MVTLKEVRAWNDSLSNTTDTRTYLFVGATGGIGYATLQALVKHTKSPKIYIVGRSKAKFQAQLDQLKKLNKDAQLIFLEGDVSYVKEVDRLCEEIRQKEKKLDLMFMSQGSLELGDRKFTNEGLSIVQCLRYYSRFRFIEKLKPLLLASTSVSPRVISVLAGGQEHQLYLDDLDLLKPGAYSVVKAADNAATMHTLTMEHLSSQLPPDSRLAFAHIFPGLVATDLLGNTMANMSGWKHALGLLARWTVVPIVNFFIASSASATGERVLYVATNPRYAQPPNGVARVHQDGEIVTNDKVLGPLREEGAPAKIWDHAKEVYERITGSSK